MDFAGSEITQHAMRCRIKKGGGYYSPSLPGRFSPDEVLEILKIAKRMNTNLLFRGKKDDYSSVISRPVHEADSPNLGPRMKMGGTIPPLPVRM